MFVHKDMTRKEKSSDSSARGLTNDPEKVYLKLTAEEKAINLDNMLDLILQWVLHYLASDSASQHNYRNTWQSICKYYGFQQSEAHFMKISEISREDCERPEKGYQHVYTYQLCTMLPMGHIYLTPLRANNNDNAFVAIVTLLNLHYLGNMYYQALTWDKNNIISIKNNILIKKRDKVLN